MREQVGTVRGGSWISPRHAPRPPATIAALHHRTITPTLTPSARPPSVVIVTRAAHQLHQSLVKFLLSVSACPGMLRPVCSYS
jgi:hypothetical protein